MVSLRPRQRLPPVYRWGFMVRSYVTCLIHLHLTLYEAREGGQFRRRAGDRPVLPAALVTDLSALPCVRASSVRGRGTVRARFCLQALFRPPMCVRVFMSPAPRSSDCGSLMSVHTGPGQALRPSMSPVHRGQVALRARRGCPCSLLINVLFTALPRSGRRWPLKMVVCLVV